MVETAARHVYIKTGGVARAMSLDQYARHCADPTFDAQMKAGATDAEKAALDAAVAAQALDAK